MSVYDSYKPLRNYLRNFALIDALDVVRAYMQHLQYDVPLPSNLNVPWNFKYSHDSLGVYEWQLDILSREIILNCQTYGKKSLRIWDNFAAVLNMIKNLEDEVWGEYRHFNADNILLHMFRLAHTQFPWQQPLNGNSLLRYFKIFSAPAFIPILSASFGLTASDLYTIGMALVGNAINHLGWNLASKTNIPGITSASVDTFMRYFSADLKQLRNVMASKQSYDHSWAFTFNALRQFPLIRYDAADQNNVLAPVPRFLLSRFTEGVFYDICGTPGFDNAIGPSFQQYIGDVIAVANVNNGLVLASEQPYRVGKNDKQSVDWIVSDQSAELFIECKAKKLRWDAKYNPTSQTLTDDLSAMADSVVQIYKTLTDALQGHYHHWKDSGKLIFPLIVTLEDWFIFGDKIYSLLDAAIAEKMAAKQLDLAMLTKYPYSICTTEDAEIGMQVINHIGINRVMELRFADNHRLWPITTVFKQLVNANSLRVRQTLFPDDYQKIHPGIGS